MEAAVVVAIVTSATAILTTVTNVFLLMYMKKLDLGSAKDLKVLELDQSGGKSILEANVQLELQRREQAHAFFKDTLVAAEKESAPVVKVLGDVWRVFQVAKESVRTMSQLAHDGSPKCDLKELKRLREEGSAIYTAHGATLGVARGIVHEALAKLKYSIEELGKFEGKKAQTADSLELTMALVLAQHVIDDCQQTFLNAIGRAKQDAIGMGLRLQYELEDRQQGASLLALDAGQQEERNRS